MNRHLLGRVSTYILQNKEKLTDDWPGSIAAFACLLNDGKLPGKIKKADEYDEDPIEYRGRQLLQLTVEQADRLFHSAESLPQKDWKNKTKLQQNYLVAIEELLTGKVLLNKLAVQYLVVLYNQSEGGPAPMNLIHDWIGRTPGLSEQVNAFDKLQRNGLVKWHKSTTYGGLYSITKKGKQHAEQKLISVG